MKIEKNCDFLKTIIKLINQNEKFIEIKPKDYTLKKIILVNVLDIKIKKNKK